MGGKDGTGEEVQCINAFHDECDIIVKGAEHIFATTIMSMSNTW